MKVNNQYYVMRHGQSQANEKKIIVSSPGNGVSDYGLTKTGKAQAALAIENFANLDKNSIIYASDFLRARQTAQIADSLLMTQHGVTYTPLLRERFFGNWELTQDINYSRVWEEDAQNLSAAHNNVESVESVLNRVLDCIFVIEKKNAGKKILLVSHGDTLQIFLTFLQGLSPHRHREIDHLETAQIRNAIP